MMIVTNDNYSTISAVNDFLSGSHSLNNSNFMYGTVLFPLTIQRKYGGYSAIRTIYEVYHQFNADYNDQKFISIINIALNRAGYSENFEMCVRAMYSYAFNPSLWFSNVVNMDNSPWVNSSIKNEYLTKSNVTKKYDGSIGPLQSVYYSFKVPNESVRSVNFKISFENENGWVQQYRRENSSSYIVYRENYNIDFLDHDLGGIVNEYGIILTNVGLTSCSFSMEVTTYSQNETELFKLNHRLIEKVIYLNKSEYSEFKITFEHSGLKIFQTLGDKDTKMELYNSSGLLLNNISSCDDAGFEYNSMISYNCVSNEEYTIRTYFYRAEDCGFFRLLITNSTMDKVISNDIKTYEDFRNFNYDSLNYLSYASQYKSHIITFTPLTSGLYTISLDSLFDNYLYIINPLASSILIDGLDFNDDEDDYKASITRYLAAGIPYLIIFCQYDPSEQFTDLDSGDDIRILINRVL